MMLRNGALTINEVREMEGLPPVSWGDQAWLPAGLLPVGAPRGEEDEQRAGNGRRRTLVGRRRRVRGHDRKKRAEIAARHMTERPKLEKRLRRDLSAFFRELEEAVLQAWDESTGEQGFGTRIQFALPARVDRLLDPEELAKKLSERTRATNRWGVVLGGSFEQGITGDPDDTPWDDGVEAVTEYAARYAETHHIDIAKTARQELVDTVAAGVAENETWDELRLRIVEKFGQMKESAAARIATTETTKLYGAGGQAFRDTYEIGSKQWISTGVNTRPTHAAADGQIVKNSELFTVGNDRMMFPGDGSLAEEVCNCNCVAAGVTS